MSSDSDCIDLDSDKPPAQRSQRLFLALWPDDDARQQLTAHVRQWAWPPACAQCLPEDWHLTLHFIGPVYAGRVADVIALAAVPLQPFTLTLDKPSRWPHGLAVLGTSQMPTPLRALHECLGVALHGLDLPVDSRPYQPHVTLARRAAEAITPARPKPVVWQVRRYALVVSTGFAGPRYRVIHQYEG